MPPKPRVRDVTAGTHSDGRVVLPAQHPATVARRRQESRDATSNTAAVGNTFQQVYAPGYAALLEVPAAAVHHLPDPGLHVTRLVLCSNYDAAAADPAATCGMGARCKCVHADTRGARERGGVHVNYAWRTAEDVTYERFRPGKVLHVAPPNGKAATDVMDSQLALKTKALQAKRRPLSHCAHYYFNRACNLGAECQFVHAVFIDPSARKYQRAPMPSQLGRAHKDRPAATTATPADVAASRVAPLTTPDVVLPPVATTSRRSRYSPCSVGSDESPLSADPSLDATPPVATPELSPASSGCAPTSERSGPIRFRHDPYSVIDVRFACL